VAAAATPGHAQPLEIAAPPLPLTVAEEGTALFGVGVKGTAPFEYLWFFNGQPLAGATADSLTLAQVQLSQAGDYSVRVRAGAEEAVSAAARLTVLPLPAIAGQPQDVRVPVGGTVVLRVIAQGTGAVSYQWQFDGRDLAGEVRDTLSLANAQPGQSGGYRVVVTDTVGTRASRTAQVTVGEGPVFLSIEVQAAGVLLSWAESPTAWTLEEAADLAAPQSWAPSSAAPVSNAGRWQALLPLSSPTHRYFRLRSP
jgi:hypothetical protein